LNLAGSVLCTDVRPQRYGPPPPDAPTFGPNDRCAAFDFQLGPWQETPEQTPAEASASAQARLEAARGHYARALELEPDNLRSRLGYAYVLDRLGRADMRSYSHLKKARRGCAAGRRMGRSPVNGDRRASAHLATSLAIAAAWELQNVSSQPTVIYVRRWSCRWRIARSGYRSRRT
jgi:hypothetical protein